MGSIVMTVPRGFAARPANMGENVHFFSVGKHFSGKADKLVNWGSCPVMPPENPQGKPSISMKDAQKLVTKMLDWDKGTHPYLAYQACGLIKDDEEVKTHTVAVMMGSVAEDRVFLPGETVADLIVDVPKDLPRESERALKNLLEGRDPNKVDNFFIGLTKLLRKLDMPVEIDALNRPYMAHFFDSDGRGFHKGIRNQSLEFVSALSRINTYWKSALEDYAKYREKTSTINNKYESSVALTHAYLKLGHMIHLICDMCVPAHTLNDLHAPGLAKKDSLERYMTLKNWEDIRRKKSKPNVRIWDNASLFPISIGSNIILSEIEKFDVVTFVKSVAHNTRRFRSVDGTGRDMSDRERKEFEDEVMDALPSKWRDEVNDSGYLNQDRKGRLSDLECFMQGSVLVPQAISVSAQLIANFLETARNSA